MKLIDIPTFNAEDGLLGAIEFSELPFVPVRSFFVYDVQDQKSRGRHAHVIGEQFIVCFEGQVTVNGYDGRGKYRVILSSPRQGLYIPKMTWLEIIYERGSRLLILASTKYDRADYITDIGKFRIET